MQPDQQSGDYGYDLVHEALSRPGVPAPRSGAADVPATERPGEPEQYGGDYSYDEAHGF